MNKPVKRKEYGHMQSVVDPVREVCPKTGQYIAPKEISKLLTVRHFLKNKTTCLPHPLDKYKAMGVENLTEKQVESAYNIIKEFGACKTVH